MPCLCEPKSTSDQHMCVLPSKIAFIKLKLNTLNVLGVLPRPTYSATARMERCTIRFAYAFLVLCMKLYAMGVCKSPYDVHLARCARRDKVWCHRLENDSSSKIVNFVWVIIGAGTDESFIHSTMLRATLMLLLLDVSDAGKKANILFLASDDMRPEMSP